MQINWFGLVFIDDNSKRILMISYDLKFIKNSEYIHNKKIAKIQGLSGKNPAIVNIIRMVSWLDIFRIALILFLCRAGTILSSYIYCLI